MSVVGRNAGERSDAGVEEPFVAPRKDFKGIGMAIGGVGDPGVFFPEGSSGSSFCIAFSLYNSEAPHYL
jgi:hypothetical protein